MNSIWFHRRLRLAVAATATILVGAALASAAVAGLGALSLGPAAASQYPKKVTVCHRTHSKKHPWVKISISTHALKAHLRHGDFVVDASNPCPPNTPVSIGSVKNKHHGKGNAKSKSGKNSAQAKGKAKSGKNSAQAKGNAKSGKNSAQAKGNATGGKNDAQAKGKGKSAKNGAQGKGNGKTNSAAPKNDHPNNKGGNGHGNK
jgi:hypothetical protein